MATAPRPHLHTRGPRRPARPARPPGHSLNSSAYPGGTGGVSLMNRLRRRFAFGAVAALAVVVPAGLAWACVAPVSLTTSSNTVQPGGTVRVIGREMAPGAPVEIHIDSPTGPLLATTVDQPGGMSSKWELDVPIPANTQYGTHVLYGVQKY